MRVKSIISICNWKKNQHNIFFAMILWMRFIGFISLRSFSWKTKTKKSKIQNRKKKMKWSCVASSFSLFIVLNNELSLTGQLPKPAACCSSIYKHRGKLFHHTLVAPKWENRTPSEWAWCVVCGRNEAWFTMFTWDKS